MPIDVGRIIVKLNGREATKKAVIVEIIDKNFVLISGAEISGVRRRRANIRHLMPLESQLNVPRGASDEEIQKALSSAGLTEDFATPVKLGL
ncbi:MAG: 50S ribosomal protein L14e [Promethearchaeota archaeon]